MTNIFSNANATTPWLMPFSKEGNGRINLFYFPHAGGGASSFFQWARRLPNELNSYAIQLPGRETRLRETPIDNLPQVVEGLVGVLRPYLNKPFIFWGHSMGALLSYEVTRALAKQHIRPQRLIVSGYNAPHIPYADPHIHHLPQDEFMTALQELNGTPAEVLADEELRSLLLPLLRADFKLVEQYQPKTAVSLPVPITILNGDADEKTNREDLEAWQAHSTSPLELFEFSGDHFFIHHHQPDLVNTVLNIFKRHL